MTAKINHKITQGSTFNPVMRWESAEKVYVPITNITKSAPVVITATGHNLVNNWRVKFTNIGGMKELNSDSQYHQCTVVDPNTINVNTINSLGYTAYSSGGVVEYNKPVDLTGFTARMQIRAKVDSDTIIHELTTENGGIVLNNVDKTIKLWISAGVTQTFTFQQAVYSLEMISSGGIVTQYAAGTISLIKEVTR